MNLKGEMSMLNVLHLEGTDVNVITAELQKKRDEMPQFFNQSPIVIDCAMLGESVSEFDFSTLKESLLKLGFIPVGVRNHPSSINAVLSKAGWAVMRESLKPSMRSEVENVTSEIENSDDENTESVHNSDQSNDQEVEAIQELEQKPMPVKFNSLTVDRPVRSGQQINKSARIFCQSLQAELIAIAGRYQLLDESDTNLIGKPAMVKLSGEKLVIEPLIA